MLSQNVDALESAEYNSIICTFIISLKGYNKPHFQRSWESFWTKICEICEICDLNL